MQSLKASRDSSVRNHRNEVRGRQKPEKADHINISTPDMYMTGCAMRLLGTGVCR